MFDDSNFVFSCKHGQAQQIGCTKIAANFWSVFWKACNHRTSLPPAGHEGRGICLAGIVEASQNMFASCLVGRPGKHCPDRERGGGKGTGESTQGTYFR